MKFKDFYTLFGAATEELDSARYLSEWSSSNIFYPDPDDAGPDPDEVLATLDNIWTVAHTTFKEIRAVTGLTQVEFGIHYCIPLRTVQNWEARNNCPTYFRLLLADQLGMLKVQREN